MMKEYHSSVPHHCVSEKATEYEFAGLVSAL